MLKFLIFISLIFLVFQQYAFSQAELDELHEDHLDQLRGATSGIEEKLISDYGTLYLVENRSMRKYWSGGLKYGNYITSSTDTVHSFALSLEFTPKHYYAYGIEGGWNYIKKTALTEKIEEEQQVTIETKKPDLFMLAYFKFKPIVGHLNYLNSGSFPIEFSFSMGAGAGSSDTQGLIPLVGLGPSFAISLSPKWNLDVSLQFHFLSPFNDKNSESNTMASIGITRIFN